ncbi:tyrosine decarboxylase MfnA [Methanotorris formicicus]|uniref:Probable L-tyrosine/L-aspartate decarboxylase n=1 Tax=Methanotorris formicicus Mc-S-70 TaxID=647171 RepID=H1KW82_9EURY|nr:tyrosine decarboxylase MfnA [Methanotorris formicicus]EHP89665.1 Tyrosine decarboxylase [Methanotorris formicicus Mc-S-70]
MDEKKVLEALKEYRKIDLKYEDGRILGSMCTKPHPISKKIVEMFLETNLGDPGLFKGTKKLEEEVIGMIGELLHNKNAFGYIITGGTEANLMAMRVIKNMKNRNAKILIPETAHFSFDKAEDMMDLKFIKVPITKDYTIDVDFVRDYVEDHKVDGIVGIAGSTELGTIDNIEELSKIAIDNDVYLHVDAAFGGFVIPFLDKKYKKKRINYNFDFSLEGVCSITIDPHKMGLSPIPAGGILFRNTPLKKYLDIEAPYLTETQQATIVGTRVGFGVACTWGIMKLLGKDGYKKIVSECMGNTIYLTKKAREYGIECVIDPIMNIVALKDENPNETCLKLREKGWYVSICKCVNALRIVVMPHVKKEHIDEFVEVLASLRV